MKMLKFLNFLFLTFNLYYIKQILSVAVEESNTGAILSFPYKSDGSLYNITWEVEPAQFGFHNYGGSLIGYLVLPANESYKTECTQEPDNLNEYIHFLEDWTGDSNVIWFMLIDIQDCYFVTKVENAEALGASGAIVLDSRVEDEYTMWPPENWEDDITIPSVLLDEIHAELLMKEIGVTGWNTKNLTYPGYNMVWTVAQLEWGLPHDDDRVEWSIWTSSNDIYSMDFKANFKETSLLLSSMNDTIFTPYYYILNGSHWSCDDGSYRCYKQCTNGGRYCFVDPEYDIYNGVNGMDIVQENLRQLCVWNYSQAYGNERIWWDYAIAWDAYCFNGTEKTSTFTSKCSYTQMFNLQNTLNLTANLSHYVDSCIKDSGGYGYRDGVNTMLASQVRIREATSIDSLPTIIVNEFMVHGSIDCDVVTTASCSVLDAICAGFLNGTQPDICYVTPAPTPVTCNDKDKDCSGICYGSKINDSCGQCVTTSDPTYNYCLGCDGIAYSNKEFNDCGYCINKTLSNFNNYGKDCENTCNGLKANDSCGQCLLSSDSKYNYCVGCDGIPYSNKTYDCKNICGGNAVYTVCGLCLDTNDPSFGCDNYKTNSDNNNNNSNITTIIIVVVICVLILLFIIIIGFVIYRKWKKQQIEFQALIKQYTLMDENIQNNNNNNNNNESIKQKNNKKFVKLDKGDGDGDEDEEVVQGEYIEPATKL